MAFSKDKLRDIRLQRGLTQRDVQAVSQTSLSAIESGRHQPHPTTLRKLAEEYGVEVSDFFDEPAVAPRVSLPADFDVVALAREVEEEYPELPQHTAEFRTLVYERFASSLGHLDEKELQAIEEDLKAKAKRFDKSLDSQLWRDEEQHGEWLRLFDERKAVQLALFALDRVLAEA